MKNITLFSLFFFICCSNLDAQTKIKYAYDPSGNRTSREIVISKSARVENPEFFTEKLAEQTIKIYPNPTKGDLRIEIPDVEKAKSVRLTLMTLNGQQFYKKEIHFSITDIDISNRPNGVYILHITIDGKTSVWKIIKE